MRGVDLRVWAHDMALQVDCSSGHAIHTLLSILRCSFELKLSYNLSTYGGPRNKAVCVVSIVSEIPEHEMHMTMAGCWEGVRESPDAGHDTDKSRATHL